ncbi:MAG: glycosyl hydrolase [archaeon]|nr:glycosyl hydrolase [archaeon]
MKYDFTEFIGYNDEQIEEKANEILSVMTIKEKVKQMAGDMALLQIGKLFRLSISGFIKHKNPIVYNPRPIPAGKIRRLGIPAVKFSDGPRGVVMNHSTCFPVASGRGAAWDVDLEERVGEAIAIEARTLGANYFAGICINLLRHPAWGRAQESYGEDPYFLGEMGAALTRAVQKHKVMACPKHYAFNSMENARFNVNVTADERTLREVYIPHFKRCIEEGAASIMTAYNKYDDVYCGHNSYLQREILKKEWGFKGFTISDFIWGIRDGKDAVNGGMDIEMPMASHMSPGKLLKLLKKGDISEEEINEASLRILRQKIRFARKKEKHLYNKKKIVCEEHIQLALEAARKSMVLLKNEENILPLKKEEINKIAVIGILANTANTGDHGSSQVYPPYVITPLEGIKNKAGNSIEVIYNDGKNLDSVKELVKSVDKVVIVVGYTHSEEGEYMLNLGSNPIGGDRDSLRLTPLDIELISEISKINKESIVFLEGSASIITESWNDKIPAIVMAWYPGMEGGNAMAELIFGDINPSGKVHCTFPKSEEQLPFFDKNAEKIEYGYYHGYFLADKEGYEPDFPFGFGLSYTTFAYDNLNLDKSSIDKNGSVNISVDVKNTGKIEGDEIVQMYVGYKNSAVERHVKDLKGFGKLHSIKPGETKTLTLELRAKDLAYYNVEAKEWQVEAIEYVIYVGSSSKKEDLLTINLNIE